MGAKNDRGHLSIAANQGEFGGGEVMLLALAEAARELGYEVTVVAPQFPSAVLAQARLRGFSTAGIRGRTRAAYLRNLALWDLRSRRGLLWCNGLGPALATTGHSNRVVHLHQEPRPQQVPLARLARYGARRTVVPSAFMASRVNGALTLENWTLPVKHRAPTIGPAQNLVTLGYLGRLSIDKGILVLCEATQQLLAEGKPVRLLLAGESRFVDGDEALTVARAMSALGEHAIHVGWVDRDDFFSMVDIAVFPSVWDEPFGLVAAEAMAAGCPFVISDAGALREVAGEEHPHVALAGNSTDLARVITAALDADWSSEIRRGQDRWRSRFSPEAGRIRLGQLLEQLGLSPTAQKASTP